LIDQEFNTRLEFEDADDKVTNFLKWQSEVEGRVANLLEIQEFHKEVLLSEWETQLIKSERATSEARAIMNNVIALVNDNLYGVNLICHCLLAKLPKEKMLENQWKQDLGTKDEQISRVQSLTWDAYWSFLIKPHGQQMTIKCLADIVDFMVPELSDAMYMGQLH